MLGMVSHTVTTDQKSITCEEYVCHTMHTLNLVFEQFHNLRDWFGEINASNEVVPRISWQVRLLESQRPVGEPGYLRKSSGCRVIPELVEQSPARDSRGSKDQGVRHIAPLEKVLKNG